MSKDIIAAALLVIVGLSLAGVTGGLVALTVSVVRVNRRRMWR